jgi:tetratricopeptide (TPR) repeat protein
MAAASPSAPVFRTLSDEGAGATHARVLEEAVRPAAARGVHKVVPLLKRAVGAMGKSDYRSAAQLGLKALDIDENNPVAAHVVAIALERAGQTALALGMYERAVEKDPFNPEVYHSLGNLAAKLGMHDAAIKLFSQALTLRPGWAHAANDLGGVLRDMGDLDASIDVLREAVLSDPANAMLWNSLGVTAVRSGAIDEAFTFFLEAERVDPGFGRATYNRGHTALLLGEIDEAVSALEAALPMLSSAEDVAEGRVALGHALMCAGRLAEGWTAYEARHDRYFSGATHFWVPGADRWAGGSFAGKAVALMGEQGLGDEVMFLSAAHDLLDAIGPDGRLVIGCETRLVPLVARSFPTAKVAAHGTLRNEIGFVRGFLDKAVGDGCDIYIPMGDAAGAMRPDASAFTPRRAFLTPDPSRVAHWRAWLDSLGPAPKVGVTWKSLKLDPGRSVAYSPIELWEPVLRTPGCIFINLQYGDAADDIALAKDRFGVDLVTPPGIDLKDDLDDLAALCDALGWVIGSMNATMNIAMAVGAEGWCLYGARRTWSRMGFDDLPWYPNNRSFCCPGIRQWGPVMDEVAGALRARLG